jgi:hypothetical protein
VCLWLPYLMTPWLPVPRQFAAVCLPQAYTGIPRLLTTPVSSQLTFMLDAGHSFYTSAFKKKIVWRSLVPHVAIATSSPFTQKNLAHVLLL